MLKRSKKSGFTLIELMIVVAILGILRHRHPGVRHVRAPRQDRRGDREPRQDVRRGHDLLLEGADRTGANGKHADQLHRRREHNKVAPNAQKNPGDYTTESWTDIGFALPAGYYRYAIVGSTDVCSNGAETPRSPRCKRSATSTATP